MSERSHSKDCYLALGSNLENPVRQLHTAIKHIKKLPSTLWIGSAPWYVSKAWGVTEQADFFNTVIHIRTALSPMALLKVIKIIEYRLMCRQPSKKWHARNIDIDILLYNKQQFHRQQLIIPHPRIAQRCFVIVPLMYFAPELPANLKKQLQDHLKVHQCEKTLEKHRLQKSHKSL